MAQTTQRSTYLSMTELARRLDLPESTMRYYCKRFAGYLPYKGEGRRRRYAPETESILAFIATAMHRNKNATAVELMLQSGQYMHTASATVAAEQAVAPGHAVAAGSGERLLAVMERQAEALGQISASLSVFVGQLARYGEAVASRGGEPNMAPEGAMADEWRREVTLLKQQMSTAEQVHQEDLEQLRKWLGHLSEAVAKGKV